MKPGAKGDKTEAGDDKNIQEESEKDVEEGEEVEGEDEDRNNKNAPKFSTVLRNFRPPSLAKFVPKATKAASSNAGCDV